MPFLQYLHKVCDRGHLTADEATAAMSLILQGEATTAQISALLAAMRVKGETADELFGFARAMRSHAERLDHGVEGEPLLDTCGTGGDGCDTFNISTTAAFVIAGAGVRVAKHGNRSISSRCGSADVLEQAGVRVAAPPAEVAAAIREVGIGFLFAPAFHLAMKHAHAARLEVKMRTVFNLLGPLTNPAGAGAQLIGAPSEHAAALIAEAIARLGADHAFVVHGRDGLDEVSTTGPTIVFETRGRNVDRHEWTPADFGLPAATMADIRGGDAAESAAILRAVLRGQQGPRRDIVLANAAAGLVAADRATNLCDGVAQAARSIDSGAALAKLEALASFDRRP